MIDPVSAIATATAAYKGIKKACEVGKEISSEYVSFVYGPSAWKEIVTLEGEQRKRQRELVYKKKEFIDNCINAVVITVLLAIGLGILGGVLYFIGAKQGKW